LPDEHRELSQFQALRTYRRRDTEDNVTVDACPPVAEGCGSQVGTPQIATFVCGESPRASARNFANEPFLLKMIDTENLDSILVGTRTTVRETLRA
jgi:hypothetical protein